jgi:hypothetical protein
MAARDLRTCGFQDRTGYAAAVVELPPKTVSGARTARETMAAAVRAFPGARGSSQTCRAGGVRREDCGPAIGRGVCCSFLLTFLTRGRAAAASPLTKCPCASRNPLGDDALSRLGVLALCPRRADTLAAFGWPLPWLGWRTWPPMVASRNSPGWRQRRTMSFHIDANMRRVPRATAPTPP